MAFSVCVEFGDYGAVR
ncbi:hypothetical protein P3592_20130 [Vibrio parahaemolyticus]|nr:hypothetical protein [Vibrio parahaemolyticus]MDF4810677.1 hypothetical protein [Vibrio parahaemolyticus]MDF4854086.1 hypothetical protein [Vibrio parahaemolyticus]